MNRDLQNSVLEAGAILKEGYFGKKEIHKKGSVDLVTQYDMKIENFLMEHLQKIYPGAEIVGEESFEGEIPSDGIYIDPIDGTTNFVHSIAYTCISIGIWQRGEPVEGVVYNPILNELFYAKKGAGAFLNDQKIAVSETENLIDALLATGFPYTKVEMGKDYHFVIESMQNLLPKTRDIRRLGSAAIDLAYVACGRFAGFYEVNLKPWDVAAGILLVEEAGGVVTNHLGELYRFGDIIVATNGKIHEALLKNMGEYN
ncbi:inositol monophosphatase family protein [Nitratiruptor sp. SB155-2]|uniref:inositol monophosphatase family protein n=1 Tax=Nitratiruptor sp. (strain SB155-2) TaxID=387092 RepID=UPI0001586FF2|nr:inositol monophosphatase family protein [Nitratiruptor sp. SB155-2]BAF70818.1 inositol-phosphate phosphatase [Nitratiruptor sp. SB155-2]